MKSAKVTQTKLADSVGVSTVSINHYLAGRREPSDEIIDKMSRALKVSPADLQRGVVSVSGNAEMLKAQIELLTHERDFWKAKFEKLTES